MVRDGDNEILDFCDRIFNGKNKKNLTPKNF